MERTGNPKKKKGKMVQKDPGIEEIRRDYERRVRALTEMIRSRERANESGQESYATEDREIRRTRSHRHNHESEDNEREEETPSESEVEERRDPRHMWHYRYEPYLKVP